MELRSGDGWYHYDKNLKRETCVAPEMNVTKKMKIEETGEHLIKIESNHQAEYQGKMGVLSQTKIEDLINFGFAITPKNKNLLSQALIEMAYQLPLETLYKSVGIIKRKDKFRFYGYKMISTDDTQGELIPNNTYSLQPGGSLKEWITMYKKDVQGNQSLELAVALGITGTIISYLKKLGVDLSNPIVHFHGESSTGKTTAAQLALSVAGFPGKKNGLFKNWNNTQNAFVSMLSGNHGIPLLFDEISTNSRLNMTNLIYTLAEGLERGRSEIQGGPREQREWATIILSTGEVAIDELSTTKRNTGIGIRIYQFQNKFTNDAQHSERIKKAITNNYGHVLSHIAEELINTDESTVLKIFDEEKEKYRKALENQSSFTGRVSNTYAAISFAAIAFNSTFQNYNIGINEQDLFDLLVEHEKKVSKSRDLGEEIYYELIQYLASNQQKIVDSKNTYSNNAGTIGYYERSQDGTTNIRVLKTAFQSFIDENGFQGAIKAAKAVRDKGYFITDNDNRIASQETVAPGERAPFYKLKLEPEYYELFSPLVNTNFSPELYTTDSNHEPETSHSMFRPSNEDASNDINVNDINL